MASISVDVDLSDFSDEEIVEEALQILSIDPRPKEGSVLAEAVRKLRIILSATAEDEAVPVTTAARLNGVDELRALVRDHPELYRFAGPPQ